MMVERIRLQPLPSDEEKRVCYESTRKKLVYEKKAFINTLSSRVDVAAGEAEEEVVLLELSAAFLDLWLVH